MKLQALIILCIGGALFTLLSIGSTLTYVPMVGGVLPSALSGVTAESFIVMDAEEGGVVFEKDADTVRSIASITKLFTARAAYRSPAIDEETLIVWQDVVTEGTSGSLSLGDTYTLRELLFPLLLSSSNDAGTAIVRILGQSAFEDALDTMIEDAELSHTEIVDPTGLDDGNISTARELAEFVQYLYVHDEYVLDITTLSSYLGPYQGWKNNNPAREFDSFRGGKQGFTDRAGRTFAGIFSSNRGPYIVVFLGSSDLEDDLAAFVSALP